MLPDGARPSARYAPNDSPFHGDGHGRVARDGAALMTYRDDDRDRHSRAVRSSQRPLPRRGPSAPPPPPPPPPPPQRRSARSPTASGSAPSTSAAMFLGRDYFHCPELDQRMKKYLVRLANETANHLIRDTLEPDHANLQWKPMATVKGIEILRGFEQPHMALPDGAGAALKDATCLRGVAQVSASIEEFAMLFKLDTNRQLAEHGLLFNPDLLDMATLYSLVQPSGDHPRRYVGIKWCLVQSPSRLFRNRDFCYLECQKEFRDAHGRRGWVRSMHSIKMPCCPTLEKTHGVVRASLYRCGLIAVETDKPGVLDTTYTIEMDLKGHFPEIFQPKFLSQRIAALASIDKYLQQQRLSSSPLLGDLDIPKTKVKGTCHFCFREFSTFTKRHICRKCGECVCKNCSDDWQLDVPVIGSMKVRICTVCSAQARTCHATPRQTVVFDRARYGGEDEDPTQDENYYNYHPGPRVRRSNSMPENHEYGESPFQRTAREPSRSVFHSTGSLASNVNHQIEPSEYFAAEHKRYQQQQLMAARQSQAHYRESDFTSEIHDFTNGEIRATADLTNLWTKQEADRYSTRNGNGTFQQPRGEPSGGRRPSHPPQKRRTTSVDMQESYRGRPRAPTDGSDRSVYREKVLSSANYGRDGHFPPSARYTVVGDRLERANSFDAGRQLEEQQHRQQQQQRRQYHQQTEYQQPQPPHYGNSRRSQRPLNGSYSTQNGYLNSAPSPTSMHQYQGQHSVSPSQSSRQNLQYRQPSKQTDERHAPRQQQQAPPAAPAPRNIALEFARQPQASSTSSTPRNVALEFARQPQAQPNSTPRNVALEFLKQTQAPANSSAPRNVALEFLNNFGGGTKVPWSQMVDDQPEPPSSPDMTGGVEPVEYVETPSGEWIASDKWEKGVLTAPYLDFDEGEPLETRECETCGAKQYVHEGVVEPTCDCEIDDELTRPSTQGGQSSRDESRVSFRVEGNVFDSNDSFIDPVRSNNESFGGGKIMVSVDVDEVIPLLVERLSQHSLRSSFHHT